MEKAEDVYGFKVNLLEGLNDEKWYEITEYPNFPQESRNSMDLYNELEKDNLQGRNVVFPLKLDITITTMGLDSQTAQYFSIGGIIKLLDRDKDLFVHTDTFFKVKLVYDQDLPILSIIYYTICETGSRSISSLDELLDLTFIDYDTDQFTKDRIEEFEKAGVNFNEIEHIPIIPLLWMQFNDDNSLKDILHLTLIEKHLT